MEILRTLHFTFLFVFANALYAQDFQYEDAQLQIGQTKTIDYYQFFDHPYLNETNNQILDSLASFLLMNAKLRIQITIHTDQRGSKPYNLKLSEGRAEMLTNQLIHRGIDSTRIKPLGLGEDNPLITEAEIMKMQTEEEREKAYGQNKRIVITIIE